jgi:hypothetical protein
MNNEAKIRLSPVEMELVRPKGYFTKQLIIETVAHLLKKSKRGN